MNQIIKFKSFEIPVVVLVFSFLYIIFVLLSSSLPMFWDMSYISKIADHIYECKFSSFIFPAIDDGSNPPLYSVYFAILWSVFGKSLLITHLAILPFIIGALYQFYKLCKRYLDNLYTHLSIIIFFIEPTILTQTLYAGYDIMILFLFLYSLNLILSQRRIALSFVAMFICLINLRGFTILISLFIFDTIQNKIFSGKRLINIKKFIFPYLPAIFLFIAWLIYHHLNTGWILLSQRHINEFNTISTFEELVRNVFYIFWRITDFGRIVIFIFLFASFFFPVVKKQDYKKILFICILPALIYLLFFGAFRIPPSHRYFIATIAISILAFTYFIQSLRNKKIKILFSTLLFASLVSGNFILYPERFGNGWDSSLKSIPYFNLEDKLYNYIAESKIDPSIVAAQFPMNFDYYYTHLSKEHFIYTDIDKRNFNDHPYIIQSNICNTFTPVEIEKLNTKWILVREFKSWQVYVKLFKNPEHLNENKN